MGQFLTPLRLEQQNDGIHWGYLEPFKYLDDVLGLIIIPTGFETDGGSVPGAFQGLINPYGRGFKGFGVHDYLYATQLFTREQSDECLRRALRLCGENMLESATQFDAVRIGGETAWKEDQLKYNLPGGTL